MPVIRWLVLFLLSCGLGCGAAIISSECNQSDSTVSCCLKRHPGQYEACGADAPAQRMLGARGARIDSKTLWKQGRIRLDVENPAPGVRPGQLHFQDAQTGAKYLYDPASRSFANAPRWVNELLKTDAKFASSVEKGLYYLGEVPP
ncbi:hypothetical protein [Corallococcus carmarthensis]|uniref:Uncharacterized protein n=1 Tax=Corallococcus carmarthensis TaxID=2316728 RepID=A0A3A8KEF2_9BACT|nr:hypothetical protein [Corallococcus carmarthensis]NOK16442.1 hypothetical protein [Corallococcus carmarthensis]RKH00214.1 hypothetical protein D7X32_24150 [Corallococcus carmarthensis]